MQEFDIRQPSPTSNRILTPNGVPEVYTHKIVREAMPEPSKLEKLEANLLKRQKIYSSRTDEESKQKLRDVEDQLLSLYEKEAEELV